jgi:hypothetical protein
MLKPDCDLIGGARLEIVFAHRCEISLLQSAHPRRSFGSISEKSFKDQDFIHVTLPGEA